MKAKRAVQFLSLAVLTLAVMLVAGCKTTEVDWNSRVGTYTYDQCVAELGLPDKQNKLSDGRTAYQWITLHGSRGFPGSGNYGTGDVMGADHPYVQTYRDHVLELTFDANGKLISAIRNY